MGEGHQVHGLTALSKFPFKTSATNTSYCNAEEC
jgi:hypothetical protein